MQDWLIFILEVVVKVEYVDGVIDFDDDFVLMMWDKVVYFLVSDFKIQKVGVFKNR